MKTRPQKYGEPTKNTAFTLPLSVIQELETLCKKRDIPSRSELVTKLIHLAFQQETDPILSVEVMKQKAQKIEEERREFEKECNLMYGRSLPEQEQHLLQMKQEQIKRVEEKNMQTKSREREEALAFEKRTQIQSTLTEYFGHINPREAKIVEPLREHGLLESWRLLPVDKRGSILDRAKSDAGWHRDSWGKWEQHHPRMYQ